MVYTKLDLWKLQCEITMELAEQAVTHGDDTRGLYLESVVNQWKRKGYISRKQLNSTLKTLKGSYFYKYCERNYREGTPEALYNIKVLNAALKSLPSTTHAHYLVNKWYEDRNDTIWMEYTGKLLYKNL